jgi:hypothetical protein
VWALTHLTLHATQVVLLEILKLEQLKRSLVIFNGHIRLVERVAALGRLAAAVARRLLPAPDFHAFLRSVRRAEATAAAGGGQGLLVDGMRAVVKVVEGRLLPRMDLLGSLDPYCLVLLAGDRSPTRGAAGAHPPGLA